MTDTRNLPGGVDPKQFDTLANYKAKVYDEVGVAGTWLDDAKLEILWLESQSDPIPEHLQPLLDDGDDYADDPYNDEGMVAAFDCRETDERPIEKGDHLSFAYDSRSHDGDVGVEAEVIWVDPSPGDDDLLWTVDARTDDDARYRIEDSGEVFTVQTNNLGKSDTTTIKRGKLTALVVEREEL